MCTNKMILITSLAILLTICIGILSVALYQKNTNAICKSKRRLDGKTALVTGGTSGMGLEIATDFAERGARVIVACPFEEEGIRGLKLIIKNSRNENIVFEHLDLSSFASVKKFAANILMKETRLDILINNAGINNGVQVTKDGLNINMEVNYFGTVLLTLLLLPLLKKTGNPKEPSRIVNTTSICRRLGTVNKATWNQRVQTWQSYADSKLCIYLFTQLLAKRIKSNVLVNVVDPGYVGTAITSSVAGVFAPLVEIFISAVFKTPWEGAQTAIFAAVSDEVAQKNGKCFVNCKEASRSHQIYNDEISRFLWKNTIEILKFDDSEVM